MNVFYHLLYEFDKGLRDLALTTESTNAKIEIKRRLDKENIPYLIQNVGSEKINVFFGKKSCIDVVDTFIDKKLNLLTIEQDFILGIMLGYNREKQCERYINRKNIKVA